MEHKDAESGLDKVEPCVLTVTILAGIGPVTVADAKTLRATHDKRITFDMQQTLAIWSLLSRGDGRSQPHPRRVKTSKSKLKMELYAELWKEKDSKDVVEFRARTTNRRFENLTSLFANHDKEICWLNKLQLSQAKAVGFHSAASALEERLSNKMENEVANLAVALTAILNVAATNSKATASQVPSLKPKFAANIVDKLTTATGNKVFEGTAVLVALADI